jgi:hypothetical protein
VQRLAEGVQRQRLHVVFELGHGWSGELRVKAPSCDGAMLIGPLRFSSVFQADLRLAPPAVGQHVLSVGRRRPCTPRGSAGGPAGWRRRRAGLHHRDAVLAQQLGRADARQLQDLRRADAAGAQQHFARGVRVHHLAAVPDLGAGAAAAAVGQRLEQQRDTCAPVHSSKLGRP